MQYCPYTTRGVTDRLRIRSIASTSDQIVGYWYPGQVKLVPTPTTTSNGFTRIASGQWVSSAYIARTSGPCAL